MDGINGLDEAKCSDSVDEVYDYRQRFFERIESYSAGLEKRDRLAAEAERLTNEVLDILRLRLEPKAISANNGLYDYVRKANRSLEHLVKRIDRRWRELAESGKVSDDLSDRLVFFIFGKVNAGKSSFINQLIGCYEGKYRLGFLNQNNELEFSEERFLRVGQTETTSRIQLVEAGPLVLVDSPGLHSMTGENANLTKRYLDIADALIWITSSDSPGQMQELEELVKELKKEKPVFPVITKSDYFEDDWCDESNSIVRVLKPKDQDRRRSQEKDVKQRCERLLEKLGVKSKLLDPVSISCHCDKEGMYAESNLQRLFYVLEKEILDRAIDYKSKKHRTVIKKYFENDVLLALEADLMPRVEAIRSEVQSQRDDLGKKRSSLLARIRGDVGLEINKLVSKYRDRKDKEGLVKEVSRYLEKQMEYHLYVLLQDYMEGIDRALIKISSDDVADFSVMKYKEKIKGRKRGFFEKLVSFNRRDHEPGEKIVVELGVDSSKLMESLKKEVDQQIDLAFEGVFAQLAEVFDGLLQELDAIVADIERFKNKMREAVV